MILTVLIWATEGMRLWLVIQALGLPGVSMGISGAFFVAFIGSLLTAVPLSPAGLGTVELGVVGVLTLAYGLPTQEATTIVLVDRLISVFSIIVIGSIVYLVSPIRRGIGPLAADRGERARGLNGTLGEPRSGLPRAAVRGTGGGPAKRVTPAPHATPQDLPVPHGEPLARPVRTGDWDCKVRIRHST